MSILETTRAIIELFILEGRTELSYRYYRSARIY